LLETLRYPSRQLKLFYLAMTAFFAIWAGSIAGQAPDSNTTAGFTAMWLGYITVPIIVVAFAAESRRPILTQVILCFFGSMLIMAGYWIGYDSVNASPPMQWYEPIIFVVFSAIMVFPMLVFAGIYVGLSKLARRFGLIPTFLRA